MSEITITITADEEKLRSFVAYNLPAEVTDACTEHALCHVVLAIAAALPKPRLHPQPGDFVLDKSRYLWHAESTDAGLFLWPVQNDRRRTPRRCEGPITEGLDCSEWEIVTAAELAELFDRKRAQS